MPLTSPRFRREPELIAVAAGQGSASPGQPRPSRSSRPDGLAGPRLRTAHIDCQHRVQPGREIRCRDRECGAGLPALRAGALSRRRGRTHDHARSRPQPSEVHPSDQPSRPGPVEHQSARPSHAVEHWTRLCAVRHRGAPGMSGVSLGLSEADQERFSDHRRPRCATGRWTRANSRTCTGWDRPFRHPMSASSSSVCSRTTARAGVAPTPRTGRPAPSRG